MKYVGYVSFAIIVWDHIITFSDEVSFSVLYTLEPT